MVDVVPRAVVASGMLISRNRANLPQSVLELACFSGAMRAGDFNRGKEWKSG